MCGRPTHYYGDWQYEDNTGQIGSHVERKYADTIRTVPVPSDGHVQCWNFNTFFKKYTEAISSNSTWKLLWFEITKMLIAV